MLKFYATFLTVMLLSQNAISENLIEKAIKTVDADILFMRHALAPGIGDPENFLDQLHYTSRQPATRVLENIHRLSELDISYARAVFCSV